MTAHSYKLPNARCPACDGIGLNSTETEYDVKSYGQVLLSITTCDRCGYRHSDVFPLRAREPVDLRAKITSAEDLKMRVIRSSTATVKIPELRATIQPGLHSEGFISNVEGVLQRIEDAAALMLRSSDGARKKRAKAALQKIMKAKDGNLRFTLIIKDPLGNSGIVSSDSSRVRSRRLCGRELEKLKFGEYAPARWRKP